jgi:hypothetical protein
MTGFDRDPESGSGDDGNVEPDAGSDWTSVSENFTVLGRMVQQRFAVSPAPAAGSEADEPARSDPLRSLGEAMSRLGEQITATAQDPDVRQQARKAADSFTSALSTTFGSAADELSSMVRGRRSPRPDEEAWMRASDGSDGQGPPPPSPSTAKDEVTPGQLEPPADHEGGAGEPGPRNPTDGN